MIPKHIFTIWLQEEGPLPELVRRCLCSQDEMAIHFGYTFRLITLNNCFKDHPYVQQCLSSPHLKKRWCKLSDFLRMHYLLVDGGIYLDADVEMLPNKNFDELLDAKMFVGQEQYATPGSGLEPFYGTAVVGAEQGYPFVQRWMDEVVEATVVSPVRLRNRSTRRFYHVEIQGVTGRPAYENTEMERV